MQPIDLDHQQIEPDALAASHSFSFAVPSATNRRSAASVFDRSAGAKGPNQVRPRSLPR
jgi:hypothetical protein